MLVRLVLVPNPVEVVAEEVEEEVDGGDPGKRR